MVQSVRSRRLALVGTVLAISIGALFLAIPLVSGLVSTLVPAPIQATVGKQMIGTLAKKTDFCREEAGMEALGELASQLSAQTDGAHSFRIYVADEPVLNAFAAPGGHIVIYRAVIDEAETPEEVAGVLAHEMAHVIEDHPARAMVESLGYGVFRLLTPGDDNIGSELVSGAIARHYSREDELAADATGVDLLNGAGIDSHGLYAFFDRLASNETDEAGAPEFMSTHPSGSTRKTALENRVQNGGEAMSAANWSALKNVCQETGDLMYAGDG